MLACATVALATLTYYLQKTTTEVGKAAERLSIQPFLTFFSSAFSRSGNETNVRVALKNIGKGGAKNPAMSAVGLHGRTLEATQRSQGNVMEVNVPFYWDIPGVAIDEDIEISVVFADMKENRQDVFRYEFRVRG